MHRRLSLPMLALLAAAVAPPALAQINPFRGGKGTPLGSDDYNGLFQATYRLLDGPQVAAGASEKWANPASGISGTVTAGDAVERRGLACRATSYVITGPGKEPQRKVTATWCKTPDGWKMAD